MASEMKANPAVVRLPSGSGDGQHCCSLEGEKNREIAASYTLLGALTCSGNRKYLWRKNLSGES